MLRIVLGAALALLSLMSAAPPAAADAESGDNCIYLYLVGPASNFEYETKIRRRWEFCRTDEATVRVWIGDRAGKLPDIELASAKGVEPTVKGRAQYNGRAKVYAEVKYGKISHRTSIGIH